MPKGTPSTGAKGRQGRDRSRRVWARIKRTMPNPTTCRVLLRSMTRPCPRRATALAVGRAQSWPNSRGSDPRSAEEGHHARIGSGTGEHVVCFAKALPRLVWLPSDRDAVSRASIEAWIAADGLANVRAPVSIDVREATWGEEEAAAFDAMISLNMVHIAPWEAALGLLAGADRLLKPDLAAAPGLGKATPCLVKIEPGKGAFAFTVAFPPCLGLPTARQGLPQRN